jgi:transposase
MLRITLTATEQAELEHLFKTTSNRRLRDRCQAVLMASRGRKRKAIAQDLGVHRTTVRHWLNQYHQRGVAGLQIQWAPGQPGRIPESLAPTLQKWVKEGPQSCGLDRANWTYEELAAHLYHTTGIAVKRTAMRVFCQRHDIRPYRPTYRYLRGDPEQQRVARQELEALKKRAQQGECVLLSQDEARFPLVPTLRATLGVKGYRPTVGTWDNKDQVYCVAALNVVTGQLTTRLLEQPSHSKAKMDQSKQQRLQVAFAAHLRDIARAYPAHTYPEVVITIDNAPWHRGALMEQVLQEHAHLRLKRLPSYSPQLNVIERFWRVLRRRATHNRLFATMAALRTTLRNNICYFQTMRHKMLALIESPRKAKKEAKLAAA